jgi:hypothetical protein
VVFKNFGATCYTEFGFLWILRFSLPIKHGVKHHSLTLSIGLQFFLAENVLLLMKSD